MILQSPSGQDRGVGDTLFKKRQMDCPAFPTSSQIGEHDNLFLLHNVWRVIKFNTTLSFIKAISLFLKSEFLSKK